MRLQAQEESKHAMKFFDYIDDRGGEIALEAIEKPKADWKSVLAVFEAAQEHEARVSAGIQRLYELALGPKDYTSETMLQGVPNGEGGEGEARHQVGEDARVRGQWRPGLPVDDPGVGRRAPRGVGDAH